MADRLPGPVVEARVAVGVPFGTRPGEAVGQPGRQARDLVGREWRPCGGHPFVGVGGADPVEEFPLGAVSRNGNGAVLTAAKDPPARIEPQPPFLCVFAVALDTAGHEQRPGSSVAILGGGGHDRSEREPQPSDDREPVTDRQQQNHDSPPCPQFTLRRAASIRGIRPRRLWIKCRPDRTRRSRVRSSRENRRFSKWTKVRDDFFHGQLE